MRHCIRRAKPASGGATTSHDARMATVQTGNIVLFTGQKLVRGVGEVGYRFRNAGFADTLWNPHVERGSYRNVHSLLDFQATSIPYDEIWDLPGFNVGDNFMGLRFLDTDNSATILAGLRIHTARQRRNALPNKSSASAGPSRREQSSP